MTLFSILDNIEKFKKIEAKARIFLLVDLQTRRQ